MSIGEFFQNRWGKDRIFCGLQRSYIYACVLVSYDVLKVKNVLVNSVQYFTKYAAILLLHLESGSI
jgi:hypothetical protein